jgi:ABC-type branched-subunit amino acid transport system substrate-binding protein
MSVGLLACGGAAEEAAPEAAGSTLKTDFGVDAAKKVVHIGVLNDESGPAAAIGKPYAIGKRVLAAQVNAGGSGILPDGWTVELVERDHGYNPQNSVQAYNEIKDQVLFFGTSFGTPNTLPLVAKLERDGIVAFPASLSSKMAENAHTPPIGPSYAVEARRAMDWIVESAGGPDGIKAGIVYQQDDYGGDGLMGWKAAAEAHGVTLVSEQTVAPGQKDFAAVITALKDAGATHVLLTTLPSATGPILGTAASLQYGPQWVGNTPSWIDSFFDPEVIPPVVFGNFNWVQGLPYWAEDVPGMGAFIAAWETHGKAMGSQNTYVLMSYVQGLIQLEALRLAVESGDATRAGFKTALQGISGFDAGGLIQPVDLTSVPYTTGTRTRVLKPDFAAGSWTVVADYAEPK